MHIAAIIPYRPQSDHKTLAWALEGFSSLELELGQTLEILVGIDGQDDALHLPSIPNSHHPITLYALPRRGASSTRNELARRAQSNPELLIFANADTRPEPDMAIFHARAMAGLPAKSLVLGAAPWERRDPTVIDVLIDRTPMVFSYCHLKPHQGHSFRAAYSLNLSVRPKDFHEVGGFPEELRPYYYEDLAFAHRVLGSQREGVHYEPRSRVLHRHPLTLDQYLDREEMLGVMIPTLARVCPETFSILMDHRRIDDIAGEFQRKVNDDKTAYKALYHHLQTRFAQPANTLDDGEVRDRNIQKFYQLLIPLRLLAFRLGFLEGLEWTEDQDWQKRHPNGRWRQRVCSSGNEGFC